MRHFSSFVKVGNILKFEGVREDFYRAAEMVVDLLEIGSNIEQLGLLYQWEYFSLAERDEWNDGSNQEFHTYWNAEVRAKGMRMLSAYLEVKDAVLPELTRLSPNEIREIEKLKSFLQHVFVMKSKGASRLFMANLNTGHSCLFENAYRRC